MHRLLPHRLHRLQIFLLCWEMSCCSRRRHRPTYWRIEQCVDPLPPPGGHYKGRVASGRALSCLLVCCIRPQTVEWTDSAVGGETFANDCIGWGNEPTCLTLWLADCWNKPRFVSCCSVTGLLWESGLCAKKEANFIANLPYLWSWDVVACALV